MDISNISINSLHGVIVRESLNILDGFYISSSNVNSINKLILDSLLLIVQNFNSEFNYKFLDYSVKSFFFFFKKILNFFKNFFYSKVYFKFFSLFLDAINNASLFCQNLLSLNLNDQPLNGIKTYFNKSNILLLSKSSTIKKHSNKVISKYYNLSWNNNKNTYFTLTKTNRNLLLKHKSIFNKYYLEYKQSQFFYSDLKNIYKSNIFSYNKYNYLSFSELNKNLLVKVKQDNSFFNSKILFNKQLPYFLSFIGILNKRQQFIKSNLNPLVVNKNNFFYSKQQLMYKRKVFYQFNSKYIFFKKFTDSYRLLSNYNKSYNLLSIMYNAINSSSVDKNFYLKKLRSNFLNNLYNSRYFNVKSFRLRNHSSFLKNINSRFSSIYFINKSININTHNYLFSEKNLNLFNYHSKL